MGSTSSMEFLISVLLSLKCSFALGDRQTDEWIAASINICYFMGRGHNKLDPFPGQTFISECISALIVGEL